MKYNIYKRVFFISLTMLVISCNSHENHEDHDSHNQLAENSGITKKVKSDNHDENEGISLTQQQFQALNIEIGVLQKRTVSGYVEANGTLEVPPQNEASVTSLVGANINSIKVIEGNAVQKGDVLAYLAHPNIITIQTDYLSAFSKRLLLQKNYDRQKKLYEAGVGSGANFQKADAEYQASKAMVNGLEAQLKILNINPKTVQNGTIIQKVPVKSPISGYIQKVDVKTGQYVQPQTELFEIINTDHIHADLMVFENDAFKVKKGQSVTFTVQSNPSNTLNAEVVSISKTFEDKPKAIHIHAEITNKTNDLIPGMYITGRIEIKSSKKIVLPESAIVSQDNKNYVFSVERAGLNWHFNPVEVIKGAQDENWVEVDFTDAILTTTAFAYNNAYYLIAEMNKSKTEHSH